MICWYLSVALLVFIGFHIVSTRRRAAEVRSLVDRLSREVEEHRDSRERYRLLIESAPDAIITIDLNGCFTSGNPAFEQITGWSRTDWLGRSFTSLVSPGDMVKARGGFDTALAGRTPPPTEIRVVEKSGAAVPMEFTIAPHVHDGQVCGVLAIGRDVAARRRAEQAQAALEVQLRRAQKMEALGRLAGGIAHDFNNFLTVIMGNCGMARMALVDGHPAVDNIEEINKTSHHAAELVRQILAFSRHQKQERQPHDLKPIVRDGLKLLRSMLPNGLKIKSHISMGCPKVLANPEQIHQVLLNLGTNAAHATRGRDPRLDISLEAVRVDDLIAASNPDLHRGLYARLTVGDNGHGMDAATVERIFDPFFTTKPAGEGTGLGLAVVQGVMKNHEGAVTVYSEVGKGTRFHLYFPAIDSSDAESLEEPDLEAFQSGSVGGSAPHQPLTLFGLENVAPNHQAQKR